MRCDSGIKFPLFPLFLRDICGRATARPYGGVDSYLVRCILLADSNNFLYFCVTFCGRATARPYKAGSTFI